MKINHKLYSKVALLLPNITNLKSLGLLFTSASALLMFSQPAEAIIASLSPSDFSRFGTDGQVNDVPGSNAIDEADPANGFGKVFNSDFLLLGATTTATSILSDGVDSQNSVARSSVFTITPTDIADGFTVDFQWAFNGNSSGNGAFADEDNFSIALLKSDLSTGASVFAKDAPDYGSGAESVLINTAGLTDGDYFLQIT